tara:strand:+ start:1590 stop:2183 length:594 start_codon:yes stop_codon:yes gene_type:complete
MIIDKTILIKHRINSIEDLDNVSNQYGIEIDIRIYNNEIILNHEPFESGVSFENFLQHFKHSFLIINMKCDGPEEIIIKKLEEKSIKNFFFLDCSIPRTVNLIKNDCNKISIRYSKYEPLEFVMKFRNKVDWVWIDCFDKFKLSEEDYKTIKKHFKICLVSPELQEHPIEMIDEFKKLSKNMKFDAICTKYPELWKE